MTNSLTEARITQVLAASSALQDAVIAESALMELLTQAATEQDDTNRWTRYEELKRAGSGYVGWRAQHPALRGPHVYQAFVEALDELLPVPLDETA